MRPLTGSTRSILRGTHFGQGDLFAIDLDDTGTKFVVEGYQKTFLGTRQSASPHFDAFIEKDRFPEWQSAGHQRYLVGATDISCALLTLLPPSRTTWTEDAKKTLAYWLLQIQRQEAAVDRYAAYRLGKELPSDCDVLRQSKEFPLRPFQIVGALSALHCAGYALDMEQGTGKTCTTIARIATEAFAWNAKTGKPYKVIVVCPKNARMNWASELKRFTPEDMELSATVVRGPRMERARLLLDVLVARGNATVAIMSYEAVSNMWDCLESWTWNLAVADEAHYFRNPTTQRFKSMMKLRDKSLARMTLTGTPQANSILDRYAQFEFLGRFFSGFTTFNAFRKFYGKFVRDEIGREVIRGKQNLPFMQERIARLTFRVTKKEALPDLPKLTQNVEEVTMGPAQTKAYVELRDELVTQIERMLESDLPKSLIINNALTKMLRLATVTAGFLKCDDVFSDAGVKLAEGPTHFFLPNPKVDFIVGEMVELPKDEKALIWSCWRNDLFALHKALGEAGIRGVLFFGDTSEKDREQAEYLINNDDECRYLLGTPAAGGTSLNLLGYPPGYPSKSECDVTRQFIMSQNWQPLPREQAIARAHRTGTRRPVGVTDVCVPGTIDEQIRLRVLEKRIDALEVSDVRSILKAVKTGVIGGD